MPLGLRPEQCSQGCWLLGPRPPPLCLALAGDSQVTVDHRAPPDPRLLSGFGLYHHWKRLSWLTASSFSFSFFFFFLVMDFYSPFQKTKQIVCLTSTGVSGPGVAWEGKRTDYSCGQTSLGVSTEILD